MKHIMRRTTHLMTFITLIIFSNGVLADEARLMAIARESAIVAGGAKYCKFDEDTIDTFITLTDARLSIMAVDEYEKVLARLEFKNILDAYSVRAPEKGCAEFSLVFERARQNIQ